MIKFINSESSLDEQEKVFRWLETSGDNRQYFENLKILWTLSALPDERADESDYLKFKSRYQLTDSKSKINKHRIFYISAAIVVAASFLLFLSVSSYFAEPGFITKETIHLYNTSIAVSYHNLPDGSRATLFPQGHLYYNPDFVSKREVLLEGKGYFEVAANSESPFRVYTPSAEVKVTATKFLIDIPDVKGVDRLIVFLEEGKACLNPIQGGGQIVMNPGDLVTIHDDFSVARIVKAEQVPGMEILVGNLRFENEKMGAILKKLESYYNVSFVCHSAEIREMLFTGDLKNETLESLLELFYQTMNVEYAIKERVVSLY